MGATKVAILVPKNAPWIAKRINSVLMKQGYFFVAGNNCNYLYHMQRKQSHSIVVIPYGDLAAKELTEINSRATFYCSGKTHYYPRSD